MQYHVEVEPETVAIWSEVPAYRRALESTLGPQALDTMLADADASMASFVDCSRVLYANFMAAARATAT